MEKGTLQKAYEKLVLDNLNLKEQIVGLEAEKENLKSLLEQLIFIAEKSTTDDAEDTTIELAAKAINS